MSRILVTGDTASSSLVLWRSAGGRVKFERMKSWIRLAGAVGWMRVPARRQDMVPAFLREGRNVAGLALTLVATMVIGLESHAAHAQAPSDGHITYITPKMSSWHNHVVVSDDAKWGAYIASGAHLVNRSTGKRRLIDKRASDGNAGLAISATGRFVAYVRGSTLVRWDRTTGKKKPVARRFLDVNGPAMSASGRYFAYVDPAGSVHHVDAQRGRRHVIVTSDDLATDGEPGWWGPGDRPRPGAVGISGDGRTVAFWVSGNHYRDLGEPPPPCELRIWRSNDRQMTILKGQPNETANCNNHLPAVSQNGQLVSFQADTLDDKWFRYNARTHKRAQLHPPAPKWCKRPAFSGLFSGDGKYMSVQLTGCRGGTTSYATSARLWRIGTRQVKTIYWTPVSNPGAAGNRPVIAGVVQDVSADGRAAALVIGNQNGGGDHRMAIWRR